MLLSLEFSYGLTLSWPCPLGGAALVEAGMAALKGSSHLVLPAPFDG